MSLLWFLMIPFIETQACWLQKWYKYQHLPYWVIVRNQWDSLLWQQPLDCKALKSNLVVTENLLGWYRGNERPNSVAPKNRGWAIENVARGTFCSQLSSLANSYCWWSQHGILCSFFLHEGTRNLELFLLLETIIIFKAFFFSKSILHDQ